MFKFLKRDPVEKAKKHIAKALDELEEGYPDYASMQYEKAARLFIEVDQIEFAVKYFREAAYAALEDEDHIRAAEMKIEAADALLTDGSFVEAAALLSEASDHYFREKRLEDSIRCISVSVVCHLVARNFDGAINHMRKTEKRLGTRKSLKLPMLELARHSVGILCEGASVSTSTYDADVARIKPKPSETAMIEFLVASVRVAIQTDVVIEWAGPIPDGITVKTPVEFELRYDCPVPIHVVDCRHSLSSSLNLTRDAVLKREPSTSESWLLEVTPVLSGDGKIGPYKLTLEGEKVLVHKVSNSLDFLIAPAPGDLQMTLSPERISCDLGDEAIFEVELSNTGDGPANNIRIEIIPSDGLELTLGGTEKVVQFLGSQERLRFQLFVKGVGLGEEKLTLRAAYSSSAGDIVRTSIVEVI